MRKNNSGEMGHDVWQYLPSKFVMVYEGLVTDSLAQVGSSAGSYGHRRGGETAGPLKSSVALAQKARIDRILRKLAIEAETGQIAKRTKCQGCAKYIQTEWKFCAWCGESTDQEPGGKPEPWQGLPLS